MIRYIHKNPARAKISHINYKWSSHIEYKEYKEIYCNTHFPLSLFLNKRKSVIKQYFKFMSEDENIEDKSDYELVPNEIIKNYKEELYIDLSMKKY